MDVRRLLKNAEIVKTFKTYQPGDDCLGHDIICELTLDEIKQLGLDIIQTSSSVKYYYMTKEQLREPGVDKC